MLLLGIDVGTSSIKVSVVDSVSRRAIISVQYPEQETTVLTLKPGWAEQSPDDWFCQVKQAILKANATGVYNPKHIGAIGIAYQMHGLVVIDESGEVLRDSVIWCDSRAVPYGMHAFQSIGEERCLATLLNSPGNFTAAKLAWVKDNEPALYSRIYKMMLPGDYIAFRLTGEMTTTHSALSEAVLWNFKEGKLSEDVLNFFGFDPSLIPSVQPVFSIHGQLRADNALSLGLTPGIPVTYKAGDQPNNALALNVLNAGEVAATAGTSGVIYGVSDSLVYDRGQRINSFAHVNHSEDQNSIGVLLCINGCGILNRFIRQMHGNSHEYTKMNEMAATIPAGAGQLLMLPFGNGAERMLNNRQVGCHIENIDLNKHTAAHFYRAAQEGIAYAFRYGFDIMKKNGVRPEVIKAGKNNLFLSEVFTQIFTDCTGVGVELYDVDGATGAAIGAGIGVGVIAQDDSTARGRAIDYIEPKQEDAYDVHYQKWLGALSKYL